MEGAKLARPLVDVLEEMLMGILEGSPLVGRRLKVDVAGSNGRQFTFRLREIFIILGAQKVLEYESTRVACEAPADLLTV